MLDRGQALRVLSRKVGGELVITLTLRKDTSMKTYFAILAAAMLLMSPAIAHAQSAYDDAGSAYQDGQDAMSASSDEEASYDAGRTFDGYGGGAVDTTTPYEGSSGLDNAPTYNEDSGSGLDNAPHY